MGVVARYWICAEALMSGEDVLGLDYKPGRLGIILLPGYMRPAVKNT